MWKKKERWTAAALLLAMVVVTGLCWYVLYIRQQFYDEGTRNLLETYEQVDKAFTIFSRSNWNMLNEWGKSLQAANEEGLAEERLRSYEAEREIWRYSSVYLFNENCEYWSIRGKHEKVDHLWAAFEEMYRTGKPTVSSYIMRSGERRVVYSAPIAPVEIDGTTVSRASLNNVSIIKELELGIGDTITVPGKKFRYSGIPTFEPEHFMRVSPKDTMKRKQFIKGVQQIAQEGAIQIFKIPDSGFEDVVVGVVGTLQFDVFEYRMKNEYGVDLRMSGLPYEHLRLIRECPCDVKDLMLCSGSRVLEDFKGRKLIAFGGEWSVGFLTKHNEGLILDDWLSV